MAILRNAKKFFGRAKNKIDDVVKGARTRGASRRAQNATNAHNATIGENLDEVIETQRKNVENATTEYESNTQRRNRERREAYEAEQAKKRQQSQGQQQTQQTQQTQQQETLDPVPGPDWTKTSETSGGGNTTQGASGERKPYKTDKEKIEEATQNFYKSDHGIAMERRRKAQEKLDRSRAGTSSDNVYINGEGTTVEAATNDPLAMNAAFKQHDAIIANQDEAILVKRQAYKDNIESLEKNRPKDATPEQYEILDKRIEAAKKEYSDSFNTMTSNEKSLYDDEMLTRQQAESSEALKEIEWKEKNRDKIKSDTQDAHNTYRENQANQQKQDAKTKIEAEKQAEKDFDAKMKAEHQAEMDRIKNGDHGANTDKAKNTDGTDKGSVQGDVNKDATDKMKTTMSEQMGKWAPMVVGGGLVIAMANRGGQQTNAELYGQAPAYGGGY